MPGSDAPQLSIVVPVYDEADNVAPLYAQILEALSERDETAELIFVDDGSTDGTADRLRALHAEHAAAHPAAHLEIVRLRRNFGKASALAAGFERARGTERRGGMGNLPLRLGGAYHRWGYKVGGEPVEEMSFSAGTGFPFGRDSGQLDVAVTWGQIGDLGVNGQRSDLWRLSVTVIGLEAWW